MNKRFALLLAVVLIASVFLRINGLGWETYGYGEVEIKEAAESYASGNFVNNYYLFDTPPFGKYVFALASLGNSEIALRIVSVIFGILTVLAVFLLGRKLYGFNAGILAASITGFSISHLQLSRYAQLETMLSFFFVAIAYFLWESFQEDRRYSYAFLGISIGLAMATKFTSIIFLAAFIIYTIYLRRIKISVRKSFSLFIDNKVVKAIIIAFILFLAVWPFGFAKLHTEANISVDYGTEIRSQQIEADIPVMLLSFARRIFTSVGDSSTGILGIPILNYFLLYMVKESLILIPLLAAGIYFIFRKPMKQDAMLLVFILTFFALLSFQRTSISYRHVVPVIPFLGILASRWILHVKKQWIFIGIIAAILFVQAWLAAPSYALYFNPLKEPLGISDSEFRFNEGMKETIEYLRENCDSTYASNYYRIMVEPYYNNIHSEPPGVCVIKGNVNDSFDVDSYIQTNNCTLVKTVNKESIKILDIYKC